MDEEKPRVWADTFTQIIIQLCQLKVLIMRLLVKAQRDGQKDRTITALKPKPKPYNTLSFPTGWGERKN